MTAGDLVRPLGLLLLVAAACALMAGAAGFAAASAGWVRLFGPLAFQVPPERHRLLFADLWAHAAGYAAASLGGVWLIVRTRRARRRSGG